MPSDSQIIAFSHVAKAAGSTFTYILRNNFGSDYLQARSIATNEAPDFRKYVNCTDMNSMLRYKPGLRAIGGHEVRASYELVEKFPELQFISFIRDPASRYISQRKWNAKHGQDSFIPRKDYQCKFLGFSDSAKLAIDNIEARFRFIGVIERFDESLVLLRKQVFPEKFDIRYEKINTADNSGEDTSATDQTKWGGDLEDSELYAYFNNKLDEEIKNYGSEFLKDLESFRSSLEGFKFSVFHSRYSQLSNKLYFFANSLAHKFKNS